MTAKTIAEMPTEDLAACFAYLDDLRESGITNMFGARPYLKRACKIKDDALAGTILSAWMKSDLQMPPRDRALIASKAA